MCLEHGCLTLPVPWAGSRYTMLFEAFVISWLKISTVDAVRRQLKLSWNAVDNIMQRAVKRGLARRKRPQSSRHMCVDEVAFKKGHQYVTVISDTQGQALALVDDRRVDSLSGYLKSLSEPQLNAIKTLSMDMYPAYISAARIHLPNAVEKIAFDHFHVAKMLCSVVDKTRQGGMKSISLPARKEAHRSRYLWLEWMARANAVGVPLLTSAVRTLRKRLYGILNAMKHRVSNGNAESLNSKIRLLRIKSRGYRNKERFKLAVMFHYGKLNMAF